MQNTPLPTGPAQADPGVLMFGPFALHRASQQLLKGGQAVRIGSRAFTLLVDLVESAGQLRTREQLEARVWPRSIVEETSLRVHMSALRKALGDGRDGARYIANIPGAGYRFVGTVTRLCAVQGAPWTAPARHQLIGREAELHWLQEQCPRTRLLSIVGPGGIGKTALAQAAAELLKDCFAGRVLFADLAAVTDTAGLIETVAEAAAVSLPGAGRMAALCAGLGSGPLLLVLDNCDRVIDGAAALASGLLQHNAAVHLLATSREPLDVQGEKVHWLDVLPTPEHVPAEPREALSYAAIALFAQRARARDDGFILDHANVGDVCRLCRYLDGIPLAIELAAARVEALGAAGLAGSLGDLLGLLTRARRTALPRHRTMEATLAWSYDLLSEEERLVLCRSAIFQAGFSLEAALAVCTCDRIGGDRAARCIEALAAKSLLARRFEGSTAMYRQLVLTRSYALGKLDPAQRAGLDKVHARHVSALLARSPAAVAARSAPPWVGAHGYAFDDVRAALDWAFGDQGEPALGVAMTPNLIHTLRFLGMPDNFRSRVLQALDERRAARPGARAALSEYAGLAILGAYSHTDEDLLRELVARLWALLAQVDAPALRMQALMAMGAATYGMGEYGSMLDIVRAMRQVAARDQNAAYQVMADRLEGSARHFRGEYEAARALCLRVLRPEAEAGPAEVSSPTPSALVGRWNLARIAWIRGQPELAAQVAHEALAQAEQLHLVTHCQTLAIVALPVAIWRGDQAHAVQLAARLGELAAACRSSYWDGWARAYAAALAGRAREQGPSLPPALAPIVHDTLATLGGGQLGAATLARAQAGAAGWCAPEVLRVHGERLLADGAGRAQVAALFLHALDLARAQDAPGWELRIACSLFSCWHGGARADEARRLLAAVLARFTEGRDTLDCRRAAALLACGPRGDLP